MIKKKPQKIENSNSLIINELSNSFTRIENSKIYKEEMKALELFKEQTDAILYIDDKKLIGHTFEEEDTILDNVEDLDNLIETKMIQETQLDPEIEYKFIYKRRPSQENRKSKILVYAVPETMLQEEYGYIEEAINYVDCITTPSIITEILYENEILENDKTDIFIYFGKNQSYVTICQNGRYIYSKALEVKLTEVHSSLAQKLNYKLTFENFIDLLINKGFDVNEYEDLEVVDILVNDIFHNIFENINKIINSARRMLSIEDIDNIFIGTEYGVIPHGIEDASEKLGNSNIRNYDFIEHTNLQKDMIGKIDPLVQLANIYFNKRMDKENATDIINFTIFNRPLPFFQRPTAKVFGLFGIGAVGIGLFLGVQLIYLNILKSEKEELEDKNKEFKILLEETEAYKKKILGEKNNLIEEEKTLQINLNEQIEKLKQLKIQINSNDSVVGYIINLFKDLSKHSLILKRFNLSDKTITLAIETPKHINIGNFISKTIDTNLYNVSISKVGLNPMSGVFETTITLKRIN